jgi:hypothetical protein
MVRGQLTRYRDGPGVPTYEDLKDENERLRREISMIRTQGHNRKTSVSTEAESLPSGTLRHPSSKQPFDQDEDGLEQQLWDSLSSSVPLTKTIVYDWSNIVTPSQACSERLIAYDEQWNSWVHFALEYPNFQYECERFIATAKSGVQPEETDLSWLAVYFSVLSVRLGSCGAFQF